MDSYESYEVNFDVPARIIRNKQSKNDLSMSILWKFHEVLSASSCILATTIGIIKQNGVNEWKNYNSYISQVVLKAYFWNVKVFQE